jgi:hypothetical protein
MLKKSVCANVLYLVSRVANRGCLCRIQYPGYEFFDLRSRVDNIPDPGSGTSILTQKLISVLRIRIHMFLGLPDPDPLVRGMDPDPDPSIITQK